MSRLLCCLRARTRADMGAALSHPQEGEACDGAAPPAAPTMADVIRERKKKAGGPALGTLRRRLAAAARRPRDARDTRPDRGCEHARFIRGVVSSWRLADVFLLAEELEAGAALRDLLTQAELAREPARALHADLARAESDRRWCDVELVGAGWALPANRALLAARCHYFRDLLRRYPSACRVPLEGACAALSRADAETALAALYGQQPVSHQQRCACALCHKWERDSGCRGADGDLDIINVDNSSVCGSGRRRLEAGAVRRLGALLGFSTDAHALLRDMRYLLDSGEYADARLVFRLESPAAGSNGGAERYGFRSALELPCHRLVLAARSRFFRNVLSRRPSGAGAGGVGAGGNSSMAVCVDEKVLPRRFARALLHAAYTDQVDLSLIGRNSSSPSGTTSSGSGTMGWGSGARGGGASPRPAVGAMLDDAFQLYEIARFLEMPIVVQGCEDAIVEALSADTLPHVLRWAAAPHASQWVQRQARRYLRDEFPSVMSASASARLPRGALADALGSPFLQASEAAALRALVRWAERQTPATDGQPTKDMREPNVVWHTGHVGSGGGGSRRGARRRDASDAALRASLATLLPLVRLEHLPPDNELLAQLVRRGAAAAPAGGGAGAAPWLARGSGRAPRCFLPYLDELKALLEDQAVPEVELARARRQRYLHRIPDTLYMVAARQAPAAPPSPRAGAPSAESACVSPRVLAALRARVRELRAAPPAARARILHAREPLRVARQIALRAVREMSLPDACAELLLADAAADDGADADADSDRGEGRPRGAGGAGRGRWPDADLTADCCRGGAAGGSLGRCASAGSLRAPSLHIPLEGLRAGAGGGAGRREAARAHDAAHRLVWDCAALSAAVPDVAMAPNANTHLLTARDYYAPPAPPPLDGVPFGEACARAAECGGAGARGGLQLDLGDGATHTPRPGSRAQRAVRHQREHAQAAPCARARAERDELRAALDLGALRAAYSVYHAPASAPAPAASTLPHRAQHAPGAARALHSASPAPSARAVHAAHATHAAHAAHAAHARHTLALHAHVPAPWLGGSPGPSRSPSPRRVPRRRDYRLEPHYGSSGSGSRGPSPTDYA